MADPRNRAKVESTLEALRTQLDSLQGNKKETQAMKEDLNRQGKENAVLEAKVKRREERIRQLEKQVRQWKGQKERLHTQKHDRIISGFHTISPYHPEWQDIWEPEPYRSSPELYELRSDVSPVILRKHRWHLSKIAPEDPEDEDRMEIDDCDTRALKTDGDPLSPDESAVISTPTADGVDERYSGRALRQQYFKPGDPGRDSLEHTILGKYAKDKKRRLSSPPGGPPGHVLRDRKPSSSSHHGRQDSRPRKSVCVHYWATSSFCDYYPQCGSCRIAGVQCVRKLCEAGERCENNRCPCLHLGEWDEQDPRWVVEEGPLPRQKKRKRVEGDHWRPGDDEEKR